jgi:hypothetical protein
MTFYQKQKARTAYSTYPKMAVQWLIQALCLVNPARAGLRNPRLRKYENRYRSV